MAMKHLSLDFWNTLGKPNPEYAKARNRILSRWSEKLTPAEAGAVYAGVKATVDRTHAASCMPLSWHMCAEVLADRLGITFGWQGMMAELEAAFVEHPPTLVSAAFEALHNLRAMGITVSITSNTNFIRGALIEREVLKPSFGFDFYLFSDEVGYAKPHKKMFDAMLLRAGRNPGEVVHVGDSMECDYRGSQALGIAPMWVADPEATAEVLTAIAYKTKAGIR